MDRMESAKSKIVCTLGPASDTTEMVRQMADAGMDVVRLNFSHGTVADKEGLVRMVRMVDPSLAVMCDVQGPKIRIGDLYEPVMLHTGQRVTVTTRDIMGDRNCFSISHDTFHREVALGELIFINDGLVCLEVEQVDGTEVACSVVAGGMISSRKGVNLPTTDVSLSIPTAKDVADLQAIARIDPEYVALSFIKSAAEVMHIREMLAHFGNSRVKLIAKIERPQAIDDFEAILAVSDGIMVARGDLGVELPPEQLIPAQKRLIESCNRAGKPVIVATQMLESMVNAPVPTRAEVSDIFNAVCDGADALMLSAETAAGQYPLEAVRMMERVIRIAEGEVTSRDPDRYDSDSGAIPEIIGHLVHAAATELGDSGTAGAAIICLTRSGFSARMIAKYRPPLTVLGAAADMRVCRELRLVWGVEPLPVAEIDTDSRVRIRAAVVTGVDEGCLRSDDRVIVTGDLFSLPSDTNMIAITTVGQLLERPV